MKLSGKIKTSSVAVYVLALMLVTVGYWNYISKESQTLQTVSVGNDTTSEEKKDENLGDAQLVSNNELIQEEEEQTINEKDSIEEQKENEKFLVCPEQKNATEKQSNRLQKQDKDTAQRNCPDFLPAQKSKNPTKKVRLWKQNKLLKIYFLLQGKQKAQKRRFLF